MRDIGVVEFFFFFFFLTLVHSVSQCLVVHSLVQYPLEALSLFIQLHWEVNLRAGHHTRGPVHGNLMDIVRALAVLYKVAERVLCHGGSCLSDGTARR